MKCSEMVKYIGINNFISWGGTEDPRKHLIKNKLYVLDAIEVHSSYTRIYLKDFPKMYFNSVHFEIPKGLFDKAMEEYYSQYN